MQEHWINQHIGYLPCFLAWASCLSWKVLCIAGDEAAAGIHVDES